MNSIDSYIIEMLDVGALIDDPLERQIFDAALVGTVFSMSGIRAILTGNLAISWYSKGEKTAQTMEFLVDNYPSARAALLGCRLFPLENPDRYFPAVRTKLPVILPFFEGWLLSNPRTIDPTLSYGQNLEILSPEDLIIERLSQNTEEGFQDASLVMRSAGEKIDFDHFQERLLELVRNIPAAYLGEQR